jgi:hypothetical protein
MAAAVRRNRSDVFYQEETQTGGLMVLVRRLLPGYLPENPLASSRITMSGRQWDAI